MDTIKMQNSAENEQTALLREIAENSRKQTRRITVIMGFVIAVFAVFAIGAAVLLPRALSTLESVETMVQNTNALVEENTENLTDTLSRLSDIDFSGLEDVTEGISQIDFESLNESIEDLHSIIEPIAQLFGGGH